MLGFGKREVIWNLVFHLYWWLLDSKMIGCIVRNFQILKGLFLRPVRGFQKKMGLPEKHNRIAANKSSKGKKIIKRAKLAIISAIRFPIR